jgi:hypothetical protein
LDYENDTRGLGPKRKTTTYPKFLHGDSSSDEEDASSDEDHHHHHPSSAAKTPSATKKRLALGSRRRSGINDSSDNDSMRERPSAKSRRKVSTALGKKSGKKSSMEGAVNSSRPQRSSASRAAHKLKEFNDRLEEEDDEEDVPPKMQNKKSPARERLSSDEEFLADSASEGSDEKEVGYTDSEDDEASADVDASVAGPTPTAVNID